MNKLLLSLLMLILGAPAFGQDSTKAAYIKKFIDRIEGGISEYIREISDTTLIDPEDTAQAPLHIRTEYFVHPGTKKTEKITEKSKYKECRTILTVYYVNEKPVRFSTSKWVAEKLVLDFDIYYEFGDPIYVVNRQGVAGRPDTNRFLKWCKELYQTR